MEKMNERYGGLRPVLRVACGKGGGSDSSFVFLVFSCVRVVDWLCFHCSFSRAKPCVQIHNCTIIVTMHKFVILKKTNDLWI